MGSQRDRNLRLKISCQVWWYTPIISAISETEAGGSQVQGQPGLHGESQASVSYVARSHIKKQERDSEHHNCITHPKNLSRVIVLVILLKVQEGLYKQENIQPQPSSLQGKNNKAYN
jgi:hypothetical protein